MRTPTEPAQTSQRSEKSTENPTNLAPTSFSRALLPSGQAKTDRPSQAPSPPHSKFHTHNFPQSVTFPASCCVRFTMARQNAIYERPRISRAKKKVPILTQSRKPRPLASVRGSYDYRMMKTVMAAEKSLEAGRAAREAGRNFGCRIGQHQSGMSADNFILIFNIVVLKVISFCL